jgi:putative resolvase
MKLSEWAKIKGISYQTAHRMFKNKKIPYKTEQLPTGTILVFENSTDHNIKKEVIIYARVSSHDQKEDLSRQKDRLVEFCYANGFIIQEIVEEIGSGLNANRPKIQKILKSPNAKTIVVEHKDRFTRFGFELIESALKATNREIIVVNNTEEKFELVQDFIDVVTSMCARIYGQRSAKNKAKKAIEAIQKGEL